MEVFDKLIKSDVIPLTRDARLVRYRPKISFDSNANTHNNVWRKNAISTESWTEHVLKKLFSIFQSHTLNIDIIPRSTGRGLKN